MFVRAYPRETQEMVFDAHNAPSACFGGACRAGHLRQSMDVSRARRSVGVGGWNARIYPACSGTIVRPWP